MVQNLTYTGVLRCGDARSELMPDLQIVPQEQFENAQRIRNERSVRSTAEAENRLPLNIHGKSLLAGNAYCGHCGAKLELTSSVRRYAAYSLYLLRKAPQADQLHRADGIYRPHSG